MNSLKNRFSYKLFGNFIGFLASIIISLIVPRSLGPTAYGNFSFLVDFFTKINTFLDNSTSTAFYTMLSQSPEDRKLIKFYSYFVLLLGLFPLIIFIPLSFTNFKSILWPDQETLFICLAFFVSYLIFINSILVKIVDAYALTVKGEIIRLTNKILQVLVILSMFFIGIFSLINYFFFHYFVLIALLVALVLLINKNNILIFPNISISKKSRNHYISKFYIYCKPLFFLSLITITVAILDRWILQLFSGSSEQGYYGLSLRIASICFLFTSAITPLILREFSISHLKKDYTKIKSQYLKFSTLFFFIASFISIFISINSNKIGIIIGGSNFSEAQLSIMVMSLYPIHQTLGQMNGSFFLATEKTKIYSYIGILYQFVGIPIVFILIAPQDFQGLNLGSFGLAIKMVFLQVLGIYTEIWFIKKSLNFSFKRIIFSHLRIILLITFIGLLVSFSVELFIQNTLLSFIISGIIYSSFLSLIVFIYPSFINLNKQEINSYYNELKNKINKLYSKI